MACMFKVPAAIFIIVRPWKNFNHNFAQRRSESFALISSDISSFNALVCLLHVKTLPFSSPLCSCPKSPLERWTTLATSQTAHTLLISTLRGVTIFIVFFANALVTTNLALMRPTPFRQGGSTSPLEASPLCLKSHLSYSNAMRYGPGCAIGMTSGCT